MSDTTTEKSILTQMVASPLVAFGLSDDAPTKAHMWGLGLYALVAGYISGVAVGKARPDSNIVGY